MLLTGRERILLHLFEKTHAISMSTRVMPFSLTQEGISKATGIARKHIPRNLRALVEKELVVEDRAHIQGTAQRRRVYQLTKQGKEEALAISEKVFEAPVLLRTADEEKKLSLRKAIKEVTKRNPKTGRLDTLFVLRMLTHDKGKNVLDEKQALAALKSERVVVKYLGTAPVERPFFGREKERVDVLGLLKEKKMVVVYGITGIGKSAFGAHIARNYQGSVFWHTFHEWDTIPNFLSPLSRFLEEMGQKGTGLKEGDINTVLSIFKGRLSGTEALVVLDDVQKAPPEFKPLLKGIVGFLEDMEGVTFLVLSRKIPDFYSRKEVVVNKTVEEYLLEGLDKESCSALLSERGISEEGGVSEDILEKIYQITRGHPLSLELIEASQHPIDTGMTTIETGTINTRNLKIYFEEEVFRYLSQPEKEVLYQACVYRYPVPSDALLQSQQEFEEISKLLRRALIFQTSDKHYLIHDLLKGVVSSRLSPHQRKNLHQNAAKFYFSQKEEEEGRRCVEVLYHLLGGGDKTMAVQVLQEKGRELIFRGYGRELHAYLEMINNSEIENKKRADLLTLHAETDTEMGDWTGAERHLGEALILYRALEDGEGVAPVLKNLGGLCLRKGECEEAVKMFQESLQVYEELGDLAGIAQIQNNLGVVHLQSGEIKKAKSALENSLQISEERNDTQGIARSITNLGIIEFQNGDLDKSIDYYNQALTLSEELGDRKTRAQLYDNLGEAYRLKGEREKALDFFDRGIELAETHGFRLVTAQLYLDMSVLLEGEEKDYFENLAREIFRELGVKTRT